jgi:hypothetical protein
MQTGADAYETKTMSATCMLDAGVQQMLCELGAWLRKI